MHRVLSSSCALGLIWVKIQVKNSILNLVSTVLLTPVDSCSIWPSLSQVVERTVDCFTTCIFEVGGVNNKYQETIFVIAFHKFISMKYLACLPIKVHDMFRHLMGTTVIC